MAAPGRALFFHVRGRAGQRGFWRFSAAGQHGRAVARISATAGRGAVALACPLASPKTATPRRSAAHSAVISAIVCAPSIQSLAALRVLFVSPYPICPPVHGGGVFMYGTLRELARRAEVHVIALLESPEQREANEELSAFCASVELPVRAGGHPGRSASVIPYAVREFADPDLEWLIHRQIYLHSIDVLQLEYTPLIQYGGSFNRLASVVFEHDIYFQSIARGLAHANGVMRSKASFEYLRALRYELKHLPDCDSVQVCTRENREFLSSYLPHSQTRIEEGLRAGVDVARFDFRPDGRESDTMLFLGSFRHGPNLTALEWFIRHVLPRIVAERPDARLVVVGSDPPPR